MTIGIIGYAVPSPSGIVLRDLREKLGIPPQCHFTIYNYSYGGWDNQWAQGTFLNGAPQDAAMAGRWQWELQPDQLEWWVKENEITVAVFVGDTFGAKSVDHAKALGVKTVFVGADGARALHDGCDLIISPEEWEKIKELEGA